MLYFFCTLAVLLVTLSPVKCRSTGDSPTVPESGAVNKLKTRWQSDAVRKYRDKLAKSNEIPSSSSAPNIVLMVADDLGYNDVSWNNRDILSPNLEQLARQGSSRNFSYRHNEIYFICKEKTLPVTRKDDNIFFKINTGNLRNFAQQLAGFNKIWQVIRTLKNYSGKKRRIFQNPNPPTWCVKNVILCFSNKKKEKLTAFVQDIYYISTQCQ